MENDDLVANFVAITGSDEGQALQMLEATNFDLAAAVELFFAANGDLATGGEGHSPTAGSGGLATAGSGFEDDETIARRLQNESGANRATAEDEVRAPLPTRTERLYGDSFQEPVRAPRRRQHSGIPHSVVDAFRDFGADGVINSAAGGGSGPTGSGEGGGGTTLSSMFEPPRDLIFTGNFEEAKNFAAEQGRWLILNLQSTSQFASHQLNRDTWRDPGIHALVQSSFVLYQAYNVTDACQKLLTFYKTFELPTILVLDPVTGAPMRQWTGFITAERLGEDLAPFLDTSFTDPGAARLAASLKRKHAAAAAAAGLGQSGSGAVQHPGDANEDAALQKALEESMKAPQAQQVQEIAPQVALLEEQHVPSPQVKAAPVPVHRSAEEVAAEAAARLPAEPEGPDGCRIAVRFPHGPRKQRKFPRSSPLQAIHDWCVSESTEAAAGRPFCLSEAMPGAPIFSDLGLSLEEAGVADSMLVMKWSD